MSGQIDMTFHEVVNIRWIERSEPTDPAVLRVIRKGGEVIDLAFFRVREDGMADTPPSENDEPRLTA